MLAHTYVTSTNYYFSPPISYCLILIMPSLASYSIHSTTHCPYLPTLLIPSIIATNTPTTISKPTPNSTTLHSLYKFRSVQSITPLTTLPSPE